MEALTLHIFLQDNSQKGQHHLLHYMSFTVISVFLRNSGVPSFGKKRCHIQDSHCLPVDMET